MHFAGMPFQGTFSLKSTLTSFSTFCSDKGTRVRLDLEVLSLDMRLKGLVFPEVLVAWRKLGAIELRLVYIHVSLETAIGGEALPTSSPIAGVSAFGDWITVCVLQMPLKVIFAGEGLVATWLGASEGSLLVVTSHVRFETAWSVETLSTGSHWTDVMPLSARLAICSPRAIVREIDFVVARIVRGGVQVRRVLCRTCREASACCCRGHGVKIHT